MLTRDFSRYRITRSFGALDASQVARLDAVVAQAKASADQAEALAPGIVSNLWSSLIGASSSADALRSNAAAAQNLYQVILAKRNALASDPNAGENDVRSVEGATSAFDNTAAQQGAALLTPGAAISETVSGTWNDIKASVGNPFGVPLWIWIAGAGALAIMWVLPRGKRST